MSVVKNRVTKLREENPSLVYLLDRKQNKKKNYSFKLRSHIAFASAVLGDSGKLYVAADVIPIYRSMLPFSTIITPNWFEVECVNQYL